MKSYLLDLVCTEFHVHPFWVVHEALQYNGDPYWARRVKEVCKEWKELEKPPEEVEDFCLDVLAGRTFLRQPSINITKISKQIPVEFQQ